MAPLPLEGTPLRLFPLQMQRPWARSAKHPRQRKIIAAFNYKKRKGHAILQLHQNQLSGNS